MIWEEGCHMATKSILKNIDIKNQRLGRAFASALENAENKTSKEVNFSKTCTTATRSQVKNIFGGRK